MKNSKSLIIKSLIALALATSVTANANTNASITEPAISSVAASSTVSNQATLTWMTDEISDSEVWFGTSSTVFISSVPEVSDGTLATGHSITLSNLTASTTYYAVVGSHDANGTTTSPVISFNTTSISTPNPLMINNIVAMVSQGSIELYWNTNIAADSEIYYSATSPVAADASSTQESIKSALYTTHSIMVNNLSADTTYHFILRSRDNSGNVKSSDGFSITTMGI